METRKGHEPMSNPDSSTTQQQQQPSPKASSDPSHVSKSLEAITEPLLAKARERDEQAKDKPNEWEAFQESQRLRKLEKNLADNLPRRYVDCSLDTFAIGNDAKRAAVVAKLREFAAEIVTHTKNGQGIVLTGPEGTGKDHLMAAMLKLASAAGLTVHRVDGMSLFTSFKDQVIRGKTTARAFLQETNHADILAISDPVPFRGHATDFDIGILQQIVNQRYSNQSPTWITINATTSQEAQDMLTAPIVARLRHDSLILPCVWPSYRKPGEQWL